jgi:ABC-type nitrate/sulfonate/bicarbonate transport system ATPase subunit
MAQPAASSEFFKVDIVAKWWERRGERIPALSMIAFHVARGEAISIMGASGIGKSTLLKVLAGLDSQFEGSITVEGRGVEAGENVQLVFQDNRLFEPMTALQNVCFAFRSPDSEEARQRSTEWLSRFGLADRLHQRRNASRSRGRLCDHQKFSCWTNRSRDWTENPQKKFPKTSARFKESNNYLLL